MSGFHNRKALPGEYLLRLAIVLIAACGAGPAGAAAEAPPWPTRRDGVAALFAPAPGGSPEMAVYDAAGKPGDAKIRVTRHGLARLDRHGTLLTGGGYADASLESVPDLPDAKGPAAIEIWLTADSVEPGRGGVVACLGPAAAPRITLRQENNTLVLEILSASGPRTLEICRLSAGVPVQAIVSQNATQALVFCNGRRAADAGLASKPGTWRGATLILGAGPGGGSPWAGRIEALAVYRRVVAPDEARQNYEHFARSLEARSELPPLRLRGKLLRRSDVPSAEQIAPYPSALSIYEYAVEEVLAGACPSPTILVAHWALVNKQPLPIADLPVGLSYELLLEPFENQPQLATQYRSETLDPIPAWPLFFDIRPPSRDMPPSLVLAADFKHSTPVNGFAGIRDGQHYIEQSYFRTHRDDPSNHSTAAYYLLNPTDFNQAAGWFEWETAPLPAKLKGRVTFAFEVVMAGYHNNDGTLAKFAGREGPFAFEAALNGQPVIRIDTALKGDTGWTAGRREDPGHVKAFFDYLGSDQYWDLHGILYLDVPAARLRPGQPARLRFTALPATEKAFLGVIKNATNTWEFADRLKANPAQVKPTPEVAQLITNTERQRTRREPPQDLGNVADKLRKLTGAEQVRLVWVRNVTTRGNRPSDGTTSEYTLMGFDTAEKSERVILPGPASYGRPLITSDGRRILFTDFVASNIHLVNWDGSNDKIVGNGFAHCLWRDPAGGADWVYFSPKIEKVGEGEGFKPVYRWRLDKPQSCELVWDKTPIHSRLSLSADGTRLGGEFPWPHCGIVNLPEQKLKVLGEGCNAVIAPDNSYLFWIMEIEHKSLWMFDGTGRHLAVAPINQMPGINNRDVWYPRWSNDPRILTVSGPGLGSSDSNIYVGRFAADFKAVEEWVQVTANGHHESAARCWLRPVRQP